MSIKLLAISRGKLYLGLLVAGGLLLAIAPILTWLSYYLQLSLGAVTSEVWVYVSGFGSMSASSIVPGVSFSFPVLEGWWYGIAGLVIGIIALLTAVMALYNAELGGLVGFILSFPNMAPFSFFLGRAPQINSIMNLFVQAIEGAGYTLLGSNSSYAIGFILEVVGTALLPISSILILSNATRLRMAETERRKRKPKEEEARGSLPER
jgi:hypothetical protein